MEKAGRLGRKARGEPRRRADTRAGESRGQALLLHTPTPEPRTQLGPRSAHQWDLRGRKGAAVRKWTWKSPPSQLPWPHPQFRQRPLHLLAGQMGAGFSVPLPASQTAPPTPPKHIAHTSHPCSGLHSPHLCFQCQHRPLQLCRPMSSPPTSKSQPGFLITAITSPCMCQTLTRTLSLHAL